MSCGCRVENSSSIDLLQSDRVCLSSLGLFPCGSCTILDDVHLLYIRLIGSPRPLRRLRSGRFLEGLLEVVIALEGWVIELMSAVVGARRGMLITCHGGRA